MNPGEKLIGGAAVPPRAEPAPVRPRGLRATLPAVRSRLHRALACLVLAAPAGCIDYQVAREVHHEGWTQPSRDAGVDVLWVVDDSASMAEEQATLAEHAAGFMDFLTVAAVDWRLGVTTTDLSGASGEPGALLGGVLTPEDDDLVDAFAERVLADSDGSRDEQGFSAALLAADPDGVNAGAWRPDADLEVVFFSDEDDHSGLDPDAFLDELAALREGSTVVSAIVGDPPAGCASALAAADAGEAYVAAAEASGGRRESICAADQDALLERVAFHVLGMNAAFALEAVPAPDTMEVRVDGALVHRRDRHGWRYEAGDNTLVFDGFAIPGPGAGIEVSYTDWMGGPAVETGLDSGGAR